MNFDAIVYVFQQRRKPYKTRCVYYAEAKDLEKDKRYRHTATLNPAQWIEHFMNNPKDRATQIEVISY